MTDNSPLLWSLAGTFVLVFMFASESVPQMNRYFQLVPFPDEAFRNFILLILIMDLVGTYVFDRLMRLIFAREILIESMKGTTKRDVFVFARTFFFVGFLMHYFMGREETWTELMAMEEAHLKALNGTDDMTNSTLCIDGVCDVLQSIAEDVKSYVADDEF
jgi:cation-transporting ATPase 13A1